MSGLVAYDTSDEEQDAPELHHDDEQARDAGRVAILPSAADALDGAAESTDLPDFLVQRTKPAIDYKARPSAGALERLSMPAASVAPAMTPEDRVAAAAGKRRRDPGGTDDAAVPATLAVEEAPPPAARDRGAAHRQPDGGAGRGRGRGGAVAAGAGRAGAAGGGIDIKERVKHQRLAGQSGIGSDFRTWRTEEEMRLRQSIDG